MKNLLDQILQQNNFAVCIKDTNRKVLMQNNNCQQICGDCSGNVCNTGCMKLYIEDHSQQWENWGSRIYANSLISKAYYDITLLCNDEYLITLLQPLKTKYKKALAYYSDKNLTKREMQVISYIIQGESNLAICQHLSISKATVKTHLNTIYKKIHNLDETPKYIPYKRLASLKYKSR
jgi:DNA-binding CsgD family transcriptional regulator